jgi:hypothetical protein
MPSLDRLNDLSALALVLFLGQEASVQKLLKCPELDGRVSGGVGGGRGGCASKGYYRAWLSLAVSSPC